MGTKAKEIFKSYLRSQGLRATPEREIIIDEIFHKRGHFDVDELFVRIRKRYPKKRIAKASIYRNISHLIASGLICESMVVGGSARYEWALGGEHHDHLVCVKCGAVIEFHDERIEKLQKKICEQFKVKMMWHKLEIGVVCGKCKRHG